MAASSSGGNLRLGNRFDILSESDPIPNKSKRLMKRRNAVDELLLRQETEQPLLTMKTVSPVVIDKAIKECAGEVKSIQRSRNDILIETFTKLQAEKLCKLKNSSTCKMYP